MPSVMIKYECRAPAATTSLSFADTYDLTLEQIAWIDAQGYPVTINFCEHHGSEDGYLPSPMMLAAAAARITRNVRLQVNVIMPFSDPLRVAEDVAVLDQLSRGRAEVLLLGGYVGRELEMFGVEPNQRGCLMEEGVRALKQAWRGEVFEYRGRAARVTPRPLQAPHPTIFMGGSSAPAARRAAREGDGFIGGMPQLNAVYAAECERLGKTPRYQAEMPFSFLYVSEQPEQDWAALAPYALYETNCYAQWQQDSDQDMMFSSALDADALKALGTYQVTTAEQVLHRAPAMEDNDALVLHPLVGALETRLSWQLLRNFFRQVAPNIAITPL
ncbi:MAG TPA: LLM class flavin-dependent oxidoreductase [Halieaceae bacterium]|jgi:alkanesulfonate monooxygenase SsuD/methylene tetrahydromethanopterin reductase-like flavin-dependent oxidoreductase (luciferase family)|uniref:LLM class flavin-dependent oxidoreductase n=1 Tax=Haliea sp. TaxID=1932666 RepID=UPI000C3E9FBC|nr:LLM class flavin-dependent oxidoreductase [Haliea sp.]HAN68588.1 LLM class flavin-dependent oxidoreductase [Halieaceae bacterium]MAD63317.1 LLM class flavin-dependent oxidoreductase [Haliea sp.]MAY91854.1 LLM class flavin-dependent oxidoreductase [Haliea sp.]MBK41778.1 LLM class flavin-dependent oxidoreductase [Haliea sp.]MBP70357.1 LLM class flavin-dependent oxidoreductase [Haliea sp.]|tara:strand:+ start:13124 stop:14113 length:990 start_codon:yes stop_codon:yes gene_type:complete